MSVDMDELLLEAGGEVDTQIDVDQLWTRGRRKRWLRLAGTSAAGFTAVAVVAVAAVGLTGPSNVPVIAPIGQEDSAPPDTSRDDDATDATEATGVEEGETTDVPPADPELLNDEVLAIERHLEAEAQRVQDLVDKAERERLAAETAAAQERDAAAAAAADASAAAKAAKAAESSPGAESSPMDDPCKIHEGRDMRVFIDVVSPVGGQQAGSSIDLIGCSSVYEGTIMFRVLDQGGTVLVEGFTTATAGGPEIGEFRETIELPRAGAAELEVFWEDAKDGSKRDVVRIALAS